MISVPEVAVEGVSCAIGSGETPSELALDAARSLSGVRDAAGVVAATFSNPERFPALSVRVASALGLGPDAPAFDVQLACSAYPYALYLAGRLAGDLGRPVLVIDGDVQAPLVDPHDAATCSVFSDAMTATLVTSAPADAAARSVFGFLTQCDEALTCPSAGPVRMDGMKVFNFVATAVREFLGPFAALPFDRFVPHQANPYMVRQLAKALGLADRLVTLDESLRNPGSCSVPLALARGDVHGRVLVAGFGAGFSAAAGIVKVR